MVYCDGNSFSGNRDQPQPVLGLDNTTVPIYYRGRRNVDAVLATLVKEYNFGKAKNVLLTGCSAGGLATYLHTDYIHARVKELVGSSLSAFKSAPLSGFFLNHPNVVDDEVYTTMIKHLFEISNASYGVNDNCIAATATADQWQCNFAEAAYAYVDAPIFALNSALDAWQTDCIYTATLDPGFPLSRHDNLEHAHCGSVPGWKECAKELGKCNSTQMVAMDQYMTDFKTKMSKAKTFTADGNGAFIYSCHKHCAEQSSSFTAIKINGVSMQEAVSAWWRGSVTEPAASHVHLDCQDSTSSPGKQCNPTCPAD